MKAGAAARVRRRESDYCREVIDPDRIPLRLKKPYRDASSEGENSLRPRRRDATRARIVGDDPAIAEIFAQIERLAAAGLTPSERPAILIAGETGTGKGMLARAIHEIVSDGPFITANCTAMPSTLIEAELFGHEKGSFTDAKFARGGLFEAADGGTIFLDEIGHASLEMQAKLLTVLEEKQVRRIGSSIDRGVEVHVIAATNRDLDEAVETGDFRRDLLHRLRVLTFEATPLRGRRGDIELLAAHFCAEISALYGRSLSLTGEAIGYLENYDWPGNVRELRNVIQRAALLETSSRIRRATLLRILTPKPSQTSFEGSFVLPPDGVDLAEVERSLIGQALRASGGNQTQAAKLVGLSRDTLRYRIEKFGIRPAS